MFGFGKKKKEQEKAPEKAELLELKNIRLNCPRMEKDDVIREVGKMFVEGGYTEEGYTEGMLKRELTFATNIGNGIAIPHGVEEAKKLVKKSGIVVMVFPEGTSWGNEDVKLVIGIAGAGEEHLEVLSIVAEKMMEESAVDRLVKGTKEEIYRTFTEKGDAE